MCPSPLTRRADEEPVSFWATTADLASIDRLPEEIRKVAVATFRAAQCKRFRVWPKALKQAVAATEWARAFVRSRPAAVEAAVELSGPSSDSSSSSSSSGSE
jgi:hypothetical protein